MPQLQVQVNDTSKDDKTQLGQIQLALSNTATWTNSILTNLPKSYVEPSAATNETTSSNAYIPFQNFTFNPNISNPLSLIIFNLALKGIGSVGVLVNNQLAATIPFQNIGFTQVTGTIPMSLAKGTTKISLVWQASTGSVSKSNAAGANSFYVMSFNS